MSKINIGILSTARITARAILEQAKSFPEVSIVGIASRNLSKAKEYALHHKIPHYYGTYDELLRDSEVNLIYNPLPNHLHMEWTIRALKAGKHVLCEKPIASNASDAIRMKKVADETGLMLTEAFHNRYHPVSSRIKEILTSKQLGDLQHLEAAFCFGGILRDNIRCKYELAGGAFMDLGCYPLNLFRYLCDEEPIITSARAECEIEQIDDTMEVDLKFPKHNVTAKITCSMRAKHSDHSIHIKGTTGELECQSPFIPMNQRIIIKHGWKKQKEKLKAEISYYYQMKALIQAIIEKKMMITTIEDGIANMKLIDEIYKKAGLQIRVSPHFKD